MSFFSNVKRIIYRGYFSLIQKLNNYPKESARFRKIHGYDLNLNNPLTFSEKIIWKKLHDRNPLLPVVSDKLRVRDFVKNKLGAELSENILIPLLFNTTNPEKIPFENLPQQFVVKSNHAAGQIIIVKDKSEIDQREMVEICKKWLSSQYGFFRHEWAYQNIKPEILIEELLLDEEGRIPKDFNFHVFHGKCKRIGVCSFKYHHPKVVNGYDVNWNRSKVVTSFPEGPNIPKPENLSLMIEIAENLSKDFDYIRVDLYNIMGKIYFGEFSHYPISGGGHFTPFEDDKEIGGFWKITPGYWKYH